MFSLIRYEIKKLFSHKIIPIMLLAMVAFNILLLSSGMDEKTLLAEKQLDDFLEDYHADPEGMEAYMAEHLQAYKNAVASLRTEERLPFPDNIYTENDAAFFNDTFAKMKQSTTTYQKTVKTAIRIANGHIAEYRFLNYPDESFEIRYQQGVLDSYEPLQNLEFPLTNIRGYDIFLDYSGFGVIAMVAMIIGGMLILIPEKSSGMVAILRVSKKGRNETYLAKMTVAFLYCLLVCVILTGSALLTIGVRCGYNGISAPIQMVDSFRLCPFVITIGEGVALSFLVRLLSCFVFMVSVIALSAVFTGYVPAFSIGIFFTAANYIVATKDYLNAYDPMKNLNFFWSINGKEPIVYWRGIKLFGKCVPMLESLLLTYAVILVLGLLLAWYFYTAGKGMEFRFMRNLYRKIVVGVKNKLPKKRNRKHASLIGYEIKKIMTPFACAVLAGVLIATVMLSDDAFRPKRKTFYELTYASYMEEYGGEWTEEKDAALQAKRLEFEQTIALKMEMERKYKNKEIDLNTYSDYINLLNYAENRVDVVKSLCETSNVLRGLNEEGKKAYFVNELGWNRMIRTNFSYVYLMAVIFLFSGVYAVEYKDRFIQIQSTTRNGKRRTDCNKFAILIVCTILMITVCEAYQYYVCITEMGLPLPSAPAISLPLLENVQGTIGGHFVLIYLRQLAVGVSVAVLTAVLSRVTKKFLPTLALMSILAFTPMIFGYFGFDFLQEFSLINFLGRA
ncbi:MAG: ABC transporter permease [Clostridia bacterium]|nr:ABC transporter permease [Clostridia bacterium]